MAISIKQALATVRSRMPVTAFFLVTHVLFSQSFETRYKSLDSLYNAGDYVSCLELEQVIIPLIGQRADTLVANTYFYIGDAYLSDYKTEIALSYFVKERDLREGLLPIDPEGYSNSLFNLMYAYAQDGNIRMAISTGQKLLEFDRNTYGVESEEFVHSLSEYADFLLMSEKWQNAEMELNSAMSKLSKGSRFYSLVEAKLGYVYTYSGLYQKADRCYTSALPAVSNSFGADSEEYQLTLANYGSLLMSQGKFDKAEELLDGSINAIRNSDWENKDLVYYNALNNISLAYQSLGQYASAEASFSTILSNDSLVLGADHPDFAITLSNIGQLYTDEGKYAESEQVLLQALEILRNLGETNTLSYARKLNNLARNYQRWNQVARAIPLLEEALRIFKDQLGDNSAEYATALFNLGVANLSVNPSLGYSQIKKAETIRKKVLGTRHPVYAETVEKLSLYQWKNRNKKEVRKLMRLVFENYFQQVEDFFPVLTEEEKSNLFFNKIRPSQEYYASWVVSEEANNPAELGELYSITLNTKGLIFYATDKVRQRISQSGDTTLIKLYETWESQKELLAYYYSQDRDASEVDSLLKSSKAIEKELSRRSAIFSREIIRPKRTWQEIQQKLQPGEAAVEIVRFRNYNIDSLGFSNRIFYAILILTDKTTKGPELVLMRNGDLLEGRFLNYYRNGIQFKVDDEYSYKNYWETIHDALKRLNVQTVYLSTDGAFNFISISSIKNPFSQKFLIEELNIRLMTSTRDLLDPPATRKLGQTGLLLGFPTYNLREAGNPTTKKQNTKLVSRSIRGSLSRFARGQDGIASLPGTKVEVESIRQTLAGRQIDLFTESQATEANIKQARNPSILHIATHGYFLEDEISPALRAPNPLLNSGLILAGATNFILNGANPLHDEEDGILTAYEAMNLNLDETDIVVLSACETGLGKIQNGEGVYGLQRAFQLAGAKYVIMSLWPVDDEATKSLMTTFYSKLTDLNDVRSAFREAQIEAMKKYFNPFYWGAFVLIGK